MKLFIPSKGRAATISTPAALAGADYTVLLHSDAEAAAYRAAGRVPPDRILVTHTQAEPAGKTRQMAYALDTLVPPGAWCAFADDNILALTAVRSPECTSPRLLVDTPGPWRAIYGAACSVARFGRYAEETIAEAERVGARLCGFATVDNPFYRGVRYRYVGYVIGKLILWKNEPFAWDHAITMDDFHHTAEHLLQYGAVVINNYLWPRARHYLDGGHGLYAHRVPYRLADCARLLQMYPGLLRIKERKGFVSGTDLQVRLTTPDQVAHWRAGMFGRTARAAS